LTHSNARASFTLDTQLRLGKPFTCARCAAGGGGRSGVGSLKRPTEGGGRQSKRSASLLKKARGGAAGALGL